ncbi:MAG TPA: winged helix-turn-helix domain-containing protein [Pyrinomonadaceae bacterium]|nr:winged helix-turn-helix domain-containing protein [Pyrinomonadaceae bacterium]
MSGVVGQEAEPAAAGRSLVSFYDDGVLRVEHENYYVSLGGRQLRLPRKEFLILSRLARNAGRVVAAEEIWRHAWGPDSPVNGESLHVHIYRLRRRLEPSGLQIETMVNVGYRLMPAAPLTDISDSVQTDVTPGT